MRITRSLRPDFAQRQNANREDWYDLYEDWGLIESSIAAQYGIRLRNEPDMSWDEFCTLVSGLLPETPLGQIISIRSENDKEMLKHFTKDQHRIRNEWRTRIHQKALDNPSAVIEQIKAFQEACKMAFS